MKKSWQGRFKEISFTVPLEKTDGMSRQYRIPVCILFQRNLPDGSQRSSDPGLLMDRMIQAVLYYDTDRELNAIDSRVLSFISDNYKKAYSYQAEGKSEAEKLYLRLLLVTDYVCGMTDSYAKRLYQDMNGII